MTGDRLVCAACSHPVDEGRCPTCRASRARLGQQPTSYLLLVAIVSVLAALALISSALNS